MFGSTTLRIHQTQSGGGEITTFAAVVLKNQPLGILWMSIVGNKNGLRVLASAVPTITRWILKESLERIWTLELCFA